MRWLRAWFRRTAIDRDVERELRAHLDLHVRDLVGRGWPDAEARRLARLELGGVGQIAARVRDGRAGAWLQPCAHTVRDAIRGLRRTPGVTVTAIVLIALVIGGNTAIYSLVHAVLTRPAPGVDPGGLITLELRIDGKPAGPTHSYADYLDYTQASALSPLLANEYQRFALALDEGSYALAGGLVSSNYFETLGVRLLQGRTFTAADQHASDLVAVVNERVVQKYFPAAATVIGRPILLNGLAATIVGVAPAAFRGAWLGERGDVWVPIEAYHRIHGTGRRLVDRADARSQVIGRLAAGASLSRARAEFATISARLQAAYGSTRSHTSVALLPYSVTAGGDSLVATQAPRFLAIFSIVTALTLAIACANIANLLLSRAIVRQRELALCQMLGASRRRILATVLAEGLIVSAVAWALACVLTLGVSKGVIHFLPPDANGLTVDLTPDWRVIAYAFTLAVLATIAFSVAPAFRVWQQELLPSLRSGEHGIVAGRSRLSTGLVIVQLGFAVLLLTTAGLAYRSLSMLASMDAGYKTEGLLLVNIEADAALVANSLASMLNAARATPLFLLDRLSDRLKGVPGVEAVSYTFPDSRPEPVQAEGASQSQVAVTMTVGPEYFAVLGMQPRAGRIFTAADGPHSTDDVVISEHLAKTMWPGQSPIGRPLRFAARRTPVDAVVIGVVPNGLFSRLQRQTEASFVFFSTHQRRGRELPFFTLYLRYSGATETVAPAVTRAIREVDSRIPVVSTRTMAAELDDFAAAIRIITVWITLFALGSLAIAAIGQYAVVAFDMRRRTRDFGVRIALGASRRRIVTEVLGEGLRSTGVGLLIGLALSVLAGFAFRSLLVGVTPTDAPTYIGACALLGFASLVACYLPARHVARIDPIQALRDD